MMNRILLLYFVLICCSNPASAQWQWSKRMNLTGSGVTSWDAATIDAAGNFYFAGSSDKIGSPPRRAFVVVNWNADTTMLWETPYFGVAAFGSSTSIRLDAQGNVYAIGYISTGGIGTPNGDTITHFLPTYFVTKLGPDGKEMWTKVLTIGGYTEFNVTPTGTIGILTTNFQGGYKFGAQEVTGTPPNAFHTDLIEINTDGTLAHSLRITEVQGLNPIYAFWLGAGQVYTVSWNGDLFAPKYRSQIVDLAGKTALNSDSVLTIDAQYHSLAFGQLQLDPVTMNLYTFFRAQNGAILNGTDTVVKVANSLSGETYLLQLDRNMRVVRKALFSNPVSFLVRDSQIAVTGLIQSNATIGFSGPGYKTTLKRPASPAGYAVYVMDTNFEFRRAAQVEVKNQGSMRPHSLMIGTAGDVYGTFDSGYDLYFDEKTYFAPLSSSASINVLGKVGGLATSGVDAKASRDEQTSVRAYPNPASNTLWIDTDGGFSYSIADLLGRVVLQGEGTSGTVLDISAIPAGSYLLIVRDAAGRSSSVLVKE